MDLGLTGQRFERWILTHHADDAAHDLSHFRRLGDRHLGLAAWGGSVDRLVPSRPAIFMTSSACQKIIRAKSILDNGRRETLAILQSVALLIFQDRYPAVSHAIEAPASARRSHRAR